MSVRVHVGSDQAGARLHLLEADKAAPGTVTAVELQGEQPFLVAPGDRFVLRTLNASETLGGGVVVERLEQRLPRRREGMVKGLIERAEHLDDPAVLALATLSAAGERGAEAGEIAGANVLRLEGLAPVLDALVAARRLVRSARGRLFSLEGFEGLRRRLVDATVKLHKKDPGVPFLPLSALRSALGRVESYVLDAALDEMVRAGEMKRSPEGGVAHRSHTGEMPAADRQRCDRVLAVLLERRGMPPDEGEIGAALDLPPQVVKKTLLVLDARKEVFRAGPMWFHAGWVEEAKKALAAHAKAKGPFTASEARELLATSRKFVIPFLEALDDRGFTRRQGDSRTVIGG